MDMDFGAVRENDIGWCLASTRYARLVAVLLEASADRLSVVSQGVFLRPGRSSCLR
jgi:hypothetical protein